MNKTKKAEFTTTEYIVEDKKIPTVQEYRKNEKSKFRLRNIIVGFVFAVSIYMAMNNQLETVPFAALALWMAIVE